MSKHDIMLIIFKYCVSKIYIIVLLPNLKFMDDQNDQIDKYVRALYLKLVLFLL